MTVLVFAQSGSCLTVTFPLMKKYMVSWSCIYPRRNKKDAGAMLSLKGISVRCGN